MSSSYILSPKKSRPFGKIHKSATIVLAPLHTFLINTLLIFNRFSAIMYIETEAEAIPRSLKRTFIFLPLFSFRKGPGADWSSAPGFFPAVYDKNPRFQRNGGFSVPTNAAPANAGAAVGLSNSSSQYAERIIATSRAGPMALFDCQTLRTNWLSALPAYLVPKMRSPASPRPGMIYLCSFRRSSQAAM